MIKTVRLSSILALVALAFSSACSCSSNQKKESESEAQRSVLVSDDCQSWEEVSSENTPSVTFAKIDGQILYFDLPKKMFASIPSDGRIVLFSYAEPRWIHTASDTMIESMRVSGAVSDDDFVHLMTTIASAASHAAKSNRWMLLPSKDALAAFFLNKRCSLQQESAGAICKLDTGKCEHMRSKSLREQVDATECIRELNLKSAEMIEPVEKACDVFISDSYKLRVSEVSEKAKLCGMEQIHSLSVDHLVRSCSAARKLLRQQ